MKASPELIRKSIKKKGEDFPGDAVDKDPPPNARDSGFNPRSGKIPQVSEQLSPRAQLASLHSRAHEQQLLSPCTTTSGARVPRACAPQEKPPQWEATTMRNPMCSNEDPVQSKLNK